MKLKLLTLISILSVGLLCSCKSGDKPSSNENSSSESVVVNSTSKNDPVTSNGGVNPNTSYDTPVTSNPAPVSSSSFTTSKDPSNPYFSLTNGEGEIVSWNDVGNV